MPDNWIAIGGLIVAALGIVGPYFAAQANIKARRVDIVTEKSVEAFREFVEKLSVITNDLKELIYQKDIVSFQEEFHESIMDATKKLIELDDLYTKYKIYFPKTLSNYYFGLYRKMNEFMKLMINEYPKEKIQVNDPDWLERYASSEKKFIVQIQEVIDEMETISFRIQKYIGVETKEKLSWRDTLASKLNR